MSLFQSMAVLPSMNGKAIAFGTYTMPDGDEKLPTGLSSLDSVQASLAGTPDLAGQFVRSVIDGSVAGQIRLFLEKTTDADNAAIVAATAFTDICWFAVGDL